MTSVCKFDSPLSCSVCASVLVFFGAVLITLDLFWKKDLT